MKTSRLSRFSPGFQGCLMTALEQQVHALYDETLVIVLHRYDALHPQDVRPKILGDRLDSGDEPLGTLRLVRAERQAADLIVMLVVAISLRNSGSTSRMRSRLKASGPSRNVQCDEFWHRD
jgi:hypothetical protein